MIVPGKELEVVDCASVLKFWVIGDGQVSAHATLERCGDLDGRELVRLVADRVAFIVSLNEFGLVDEDDGVGHEMVMAGG